MSNAPERIWARPDYNECWHKRLEEEDVEYVRADLYAAKSAEIARLTAERDYDRKQSEHKSSVIDKLNATIASAAEKAEAERDAALVGAFCMGRDMAAAWHTMQAETAMGALCCGSDNYEIRRAGRVSDMHRDHSNAIRALNPPADLAAKIGGE